MKISLLGYMGSGKSAVGQALAQSLDLPFIDLDAYIEEKEGKRIKEIFKEKGEIYFRKIENRYLNKVLKLDNYILSTGGGTPVFYNHMQLLNQLSSTYYLHASPSVLAERLWNGKKNRPLIAHISKEDLPEFIAKHLFERNPYYQQSNHTINTNEKSIEEVVEEIKNLQNLS